MTDPKLAEVEFNKALVRSALYGAMGYLKISYLSNEAIESVYSRLLPVIRRLLDAKDAEIAALKEPMKCKHTKSCWVEAGESSHCSICEDLDNLHAIHILETDKWAEQVASLKGPMDALIAKRVAEARHGEAVWWKQHCLSSTIEQAKLQANHLAELERALRSSGQVIPEAVEGKWTP